MPSKLEEYLASRRGTLEPCPYTPAQLERAELVRHVALVCARHLELANESDLLKRADIIASYVSGLDSMS